MNLYLTIVKRKDEDQKVLGRNEAVRLLLARNENPQLKYTVREVK